MELVEAKIAAQKSIDNYKQARITFSGIPCPLTPTIDYRIKSLGSLIKIFDGYNYFILGYEKYVQSEIEYTTNPTKAKIMLIDAKSDYQKSKDIYNVLKGSDEGDVSAMAIDVSNLCKGMIDEIDNTLNKFPA